VINQRPMHIVSAEALRRAEAGETFTVTRRGVHGANIVAHGDVRAEPPTFVQVARSL